MNAREWALQERINRFEQKSRSEPVSLPSDPPFIISQPSTSAVIPNPTIPIIEPKVQVIPSSIDSDSDTEDDSPKMSLKPGQVRMLASATKLAEAMEKMEKKRKKQKKKGHRSE